MKPFILNSGVPYVTPQEDIRTFLNSLGPSTNGYRGRNIGNGYIGYAMWKILTGTTTIPETSHFPNVWDNDLTDILAAHINTFTHCFFICQDFIRESTQPLNFKKLTNFIKKIKIPIVPVSLGANSTLPIDEHLTLKLSSEQIEFLNALADRSKLIGVRSVYGRDILAQLGIYHTMIIGCPTYFESGHRTLTKAPWDPSRIITTGNFFSLHYPNAPHILQDEIPYIETILTGKLLKLDHHKYDDEILQRKLDDSQLLFFSDFRDWEKYYVTHKPILTIGSRLHSAIQSINRGVPAIVTNGDARAKGICDLYGIPLYPETGPTTNIEELYRSMDLAPMNEAYEASSQTFMDFLGVIK